jgi:ATP-dependent DNA helicase RecQ
VTAIRRNELKRINDFTETSECYMEFIAKELDDPGACKCGKCANCLGYKLYDADISPEEINIAQNFIREDFNIILPRKQWPDADCSDIGKLSIESEFGLEEGRVLSNYGDAGWGRIVSRDKYRTGCFGDELIEASYHLLEKFVTRNEIKVMTYVPSLRRPGLVKDFAEKLAEKLGLEFFTALEKTKDSKCQKYMNNSYTQWENANTSFGVVEVRCENTLLVDDMVDSRWTFTCCGYKMRKAGNGKIYPFALANSAGRGNEE